MPYADDYGHTHGLSITGVTQLKNGIRLRLSYSTDLYTQQAGKKDAEGRTPQYFMDKNFARFIIDNIDAGTQNTFSIDASFESSNWIFGGGVNYYRGDIDNHVRYNNPSINGEMEPVYYVYASYRYGNKSSKENDSLKRRIFLNDYRPVKRAFFIYIPEQDCSQDH